MRSAFMRPSFFMISKINNAIYLQEQNICTRSHVSSWHKAARYPFHNI